ncbi:hypothetical protein [Paraglaciecola hydrolytica]|uniref:STAS/SEC14 domain-containing protein n=1 Tax=Paraglaciecola hydrolytica TaxID=1799789 RepID=A0A135ZZ40_9ALTE|nr:hypothetical protein [Paraglaciecola hydrolytica]KXI28249.1 hypothetical protein AX660_17890 [Paraglaciecola hydrolytica]
MQILAFADNECEKSMKFPVHGDVNVEVSGQIIIVHVRGPWNIELVQLSRSKSLPYVNDLSTQGCWALIVQVSGSVVCTPDSLTLIKQGADKDISGGKRICTSYVITPDTEGYNLMLPIWHDIYRGKIPFEIFATLDEAVDWSHQQLLNSP